MDVNPDSFKAAAEEVEAVLSTTTTPRPSFLTHALGALLPQKKKPVEKISRLVRLPRPSAKRLEESLSETAFDPSRASTVLYLAYGSNLCFDTFQGRRGIRPISAVNVVVPEIKLVFNLTGFPYHEPCFANGARRDASHVPNPEVGFGDNEQTGLLNKNDPSTALIGVVYEVTAEDYAHIIATEGPNYADVVVTCEALPTPNAISNSAITDRPFKAHTLLAPLSVARHLGSGKPAQPSLRYLTLCRNGAAEHDLPASWQQYLQEMQHYQATTLRQKTGRVVLAWSWFPLILLSFGLRAKLKSPDGKTPAWVNKVNDLIFKILWVSYDYFFRHLFGDGERTIPARKRGLSS